MKFQIIFLLSILLPALIPAKAQEARGDDSLYMIGAVEVTAIKQGKNLRHEALSAIVIDEVTAQNRQTESMKDLSAIAPNFFVPDYGSKITSSIYARGLGARIDQPSVSLVVDNVPYMNKNAFDTDIMDISRMEVLSGPQSTLFGRNALAGAINIYTIAPMNFQGVRASVDVANGDSYRLRGSYYAKPSDKFAYSVGGYASTSDGFFTNEYTNERTDWERDKGAKLRLQYASKPNKLLDFNSSLSVLDQGGYAYRQLESGKIDYNSPSGYERTLLSNGLSYVFKDSERTTISLVTSHQYLDDKMSLDNDFTAADIFTLTQATEEHSITQNILIRTSSAPSDGLDIDALLGIFGFYRTQNMQAPVEFRKDGIQELIIDNTAGFISGWGEDSFTLASDFNLRNWGAAIYREFIFKFRKLELTTSLRYDYEGAKLDYDSYTNTSIVMGGNTYPLNVSLKGDNIRHFHILVPKVSLNYKINNYNSAYATITRGYKAGGFNTQMFSDILREKLTAEIFSQELPYDVEDIITYDPEKSMNYEIGAKFGDSRGRFASQIALFFIDCSDQQLTVHREGATGRMMSNAGRTHSYGVEASARWNFSRFTANGSYGYTHATFKDYDNGTHDFSGNYVPYAPNQTFFASLAYELPFDIKPFESIEIEANTTGAGRIYWNESNTQYQNPYALLGANLRFKHKNYSLSLWGRNLLDESYDAFYFLSMDREFMQAGKPTTYGITFNINI